jgi:beta-ribofuranosylaminobenzene 5'-phosphate synthase
MSAAPVLLKSDSELAFPSVAVATTARLHFGFLDPSGRSAQPFGSLGLSLDRPGTRLTLQRADEPFVSGPEAERAARYLEAIRASCGVEHAYRLQVAEAIPPHAGLGSGAARARASASPRSRAAAPCSIAAQSKTPCPSSSPASPYPTLGGSS